MEVDRSRGWRARGEPGVIGSDVSACQVVRCQLPTNRHGKVADLLHTSLHGRGAEVADLPGKCGVGRIPNVERGVSVVPGDHAVIACGWRGRGGGGCGWLGHRRNLHLH